MDVPTYLPRTWQFECPSHRLLDTSRCATAVSKEKIMEVLQTRGDCAPKRGYAFLSSLPAAFSEFQGDFGKPEIDAPFNNAQVRSRRRASREQQGIVPNGINGGFMSEQTEPQTEQTSQKKTSPTCTAECSTMKRNLMHISGG